MALLFRENPFLGDTHLTHRDFEAQPPDYKMTMVRGSRKAFTLVYIITSPNSPGPKINIYINLRHFYGIHIHIRLRLQSNP